MGVLVHKYGGSSLATTRQIRYVAEKVAKVREAGNGLVVVVSAMGQTTDRLLGMAGEVASAPSARELAQLAATGEQQSAALVAMALQEIGVPAVSLSGPQAGIRATGRPESAWLSHIETERIIRLLARGRTVVVAGYQAEGEPGEIVTLGRGGSDTTAVALAAALGADRCEIHTDVDGVRTADPRVVAHTRRLPAPSPEIVTEIAFAGGRVLHTRAAELAALHQVEVRVGHTRLDRCGTSIGPGELEPRGTVSAVVHDLDVCRITVRGIRGGPGALGRLLAPLAEEGIEIDALAEGAAADGTAQLRFTVRDTVFDEAMALAEKAAVDLGGTTAGERELAKVSVVGIGLLSRPRTVVTIFRTLDDNAIPLEMFSTSQARVTCLLLATHAGKAVRTLHEAFGLAQPGPAGGKATQP